MYGSSLFRTYVIPILLTDVSYSNVTYNLTVVVIIHIKTCYANYEWLRGKIDNRLSQLLSIIAMDPRTGLEYVLKNYEGG